MRRYEVIEKTLGETPLQTLGRIRENKRIPATVPLTYAGRLDPLASGKLLVLLGEECKRRARYDGLDKTYVFEVLLGFKTDTGDVLGIPEESTSVSPTDAEIRDVAQSFIGKHTFPYPAYSSRTVNGKPLFQYALEKTLDTIEIPHTEVEIYSLKYIDRFTISKNRLIERILDTIGLIKIDVDSKRLGSDFRRNEISKQWWSLRSRHTISCTILRFETTVSAGTYIRTLAPLIAERLGTQGLAYSIRRTRIGRYLSFTRFFGFWLHTF
jgi:tRNA pseudouridine55 synthase